MNLDFAVVHDDGPPAAFVERLRASERWAPLLGDSPFLCLPAVDVRSDDPVALGRHLLGLRLAPRIPCRWLLTFGLAATMVRHPAKLAFLDRSPETLRGEVRACAGADVGAFVNDALAESEVIGWDTTSALGAGPFDQYLELVATLVEGGSTC